MFAAGLHDIDGYEIIIKTHPYSDFLSIDEYMI